MEITKQNLITKVVENDSDHELVSPEEFSLEIEEIVIETGILYSDAILDVIENSVYDVDMEDVPKLLTQALKMKIALEHNVKINENQTTGKLSFE